MNGRAEYARILAATDTSEGGLLFPAAEVARIDINPSPPQLGVVPGLYVSGDAHKSVTRLNDMLRDRQVHRSGFRAPETESVMTFEHEPQPRATDGLDHRLLMAELSRCLPESPDPTDTDRVAL